MATHSPLPWRLAVTAPRERGRNVRLRAANDVYVCEPVHLEADADYIIRACNAFPDLVAALKEIKALLGPQSPYAVKCADGSRIEFGEGFRIGDIFMRADAAIALAEAE